MTVLEILFSVWHLLGLESHSYLEFGHALVKEEATNLDI